MLPKDKNIRIVFLIFLIANIVFAIVHIYTGELGGDIRNRGYPSDPVLMLLSLAVVVFTLWLFGVFCWGLLKRLKVGHTIELVPKHLKLFDVIFLILAIFLFLYRTIYGGAIGSGGPSEDNLWAHYIAALLVPSWMVSLYLFYRLPDAGGLYFIILILYILSGLAQGLTGSLIVCFLLYLTYLWNKDKEFPTRRVSALLIVGILIYPVFRILKAIIIDSNMAGGVSVSNIDDLYSYKVLLEKGWVASYFDSLESSFNRLQMVSSQHYLFEHLGEIRYLMSAYDGRLFFETTWLHSMFVRLFDLYEIGDYSLQNIIAYSFSGDFGWSSLAGFWGYVLVTPAFAPLFVVSNIVLVTLIGWLSKFYDSRGYLINYVWWVVFAYVMNGWFFALVEVTQAFVLFGLVILAFKGFKIKKCRVHW